MDIITFRGSCNACKEHLTVPLLSDFAYGEFIARAYDGRTHGYLNTFEESAWDSIEQIFGLVNVKFIDRELESIESFQWVLGKCIDPINGHELSIVLGPVCSFCGSKDVTYGNAIKVGYQSIPTVSFSEFMKLDESGKFTLLEKLLEEYNRSNNCKTT